jgi:hypothetical protein
VNSISIIIGDHHQILVEFVDLQLVQLSQKLRRFLREVRQTGDAPVKQHEPDNSTSKARRKFCDGQDGNLWVDLDGTANTIKDALVRLRDLRLWHLDSESVSRCLHRYFGGAGTGSVLDGLRGGIKLHGITLHEHHAESEFLSVWLGEGKAAICLSGCDALFVNEIDCQLFQNVVLRSDFPQGLGVQLEKYWFVKFKVTRDRVAGVAIVVIVIGLEAHVREFLTGQF